jgi:hypothetical protein
MRGLNDAFYLLWDESHLWGVMLARALGQMQIPFNLVRSHDIIEGVLDREPPSGLLVPGGWARLKAQSLGRSGMDNIKQYIRSGGRYLGICGGAGLGLKSTSGWTCLDLCPWERKPLKDRLPNFSGHVLCRVAPGPGPEEQRLFLPVWWPSQFKPSPGHAKQVKVMASYMEPGDDFWSSDLNLSQVESRDIKKWEDVYGINLDPAFLSGEPCIIRGQAGRGEFILSYSHLETPDSPQANILLGSILNQWLGTSTPRPEDWKVSAWDLQNTAPVWNDEVLAWARQGLDEIIRLGKSQFLLFWRTPWLLGWRRGIPGSPVNFLYAMVCRATEGSPDPETIRFWDIEKKDFQADLEAFFKELKNYLSHERLAIALQQSSPEASSDDDLQKQKQKLFGSFPGYGGLYKKLLQRLDRLVFRLL